MDGSEVVDLTSSQETLLDFSDDEGRVGSLSTEGGSATLGYAHAYEGELELEVGGEGMGRSCTLDDPTYRAAIAASSSVEYVHSDEEEGEVSAGGEGMKRSYTLDDPTYRAAIAASAAEQARSLTAVPRSEEEEARIITCVSVALLPEVLDTLNATALSLLSREFGVKVSRLLNGVGLAGMSTSVAIAATEISLMSFETLSLKLARVNERQARVFVDASNILIEAPPGFSVDALVLLVEGLRNVATRFLGGSKHNGSSPSWKEDFERHGYSVNLQERGPGMREQFVRISI